MSTIPRMRRDGSPIPFVPAPPGITPNFVDPPTRGASIITACVVFAAISSFFTAVRVYTVWSITRNPGLADYILLPAWLLAIVYSVLTSFCVTVGFGRHIWDIPFSTFNIHFMKLGAISGTFYGMSIMLTKLSILVFYLQFVLPSGGLRVLIYATMVLVVAYSLIASFEWVYLCQPLEKYWDFTIVDGSCIGLFKITLFSGVMNSVTDAMILVFPIPMLWKLRLPRRQKIGVIVVMMSGGFILAISIVRAKINSDSLQFTDISWEVVPEIIWWTAEVHLAVACACLVSLKPFLRKHLPKVIGSSYMVSRGYVPSSWPGAHSTANAYPLPSRDGDEIPLGAIPKAPLYSGKQAPVPEETISNNVV